MRLGQAPARISRKISKRMGSDLILDELWENHRTLTVPETVGKVASFVVYLLFAMAFAGSLVYYSFFQSATATTEVSLLSMEDISGTMPNASKLEDGQSETHTKWTCKMINRYPLAPTSDKVTTREEVEDHLAKLEAWRTTQEGVEPEGPSVAGIFEGEWTPLLENQLPDTVFLKELRSPSDTSNVFGDTSNVFKYPATLAPDLIQKYKESLKVSDADFMSYCDLLKEKGHISDKEKNLCVEMFTKKFEGPNFGGVDLYKSGGTGGTVYPGLKGYDIETFPDGSNGDSTPPACACDYYGCACVWHVDDSPILRVTTLLPDLFWNGITLPLVTPGLQFPSTSFQECVELINTTVTADNMDIKYIKQGSAGESVIIRDLTGKTTETYDPCDGNTGPDNTYTLCSSSNDEYCAPNTCETDPMDTIDGQNCKSDAGPCPRTISHSFNYYHDFRCPYRVYSQVGDAECDESSVIEVCDSDCTSSRPFITFPGSPLGMPFYFDDMFKSPGRDRIIRTDIMFQEGSTKKVFRIIPPFNEEIVRNAFRQAGFPLNASEICEFYRHRGPYQCSHTHTVTTRYADSR